MRRIHVLAALVVALHVPAPLVSATTVDPRVEMFHSPTGHRQHWAAAPRLVVLTRVMEFRPDDTYEYRATDSGLSDAEITALVDDLTDGLRALSGGAFGGFSSVERETVVAGERVRILRPGAIVVGRYTDVRTLEGALGFGGRQVRSDGRISSAAIVLDDDYDRTGRQRHLLRIHELGHALGYNHVVSRESIMNVRIGTPLTDLDRELAREVYASSVRWRAE